MLRIIFILLLVYFAIIIARRMLAPGRKSNTRFYYRKYTTGPGGQSRQQGQAGDARNVSPKNLDQIQDADYEIIDDKTRDEEKRRAE